MNTNLQGLIQAVRENNRLNDAKWSDWDSAEHIIETYGPFADEHVSDQNARKILNQAIETEGDSLRIAGEDYERRVYGKNFQRSGNLDYWEHA